MENNELYHFGVKGMKWGVRRYQNADGSLTAAGKKRSQKTIDKINLMYDRSNKWATRKMDKYSYKNKTAKRDVMKEMIKQNEAARKDQISKIKKMDGNQYRAARKQSFKDAIFGGQEWMGRNKTTLNTFVSRINEYSLQRGMRWTTKFTLNSTLARMSPSEGYEYINRKNTYSNGYAAARY